MSLEDKAKEGSGLESKVRSFRNKFLLNSTATILFLGLYTVFKDTKIRVDDLASLALSIYFSVNGLIDYSEFRYSSRILKSKKLYRHE